MHKRSSVVHVVKKNTHASKRKRITTRKKRRHAPTRQSQLPNIHPANPEALKTSLAATSESPGFVASMEKRLVEFVTKTVSTLHYSAYKWGGSRFNVERGVYVLDCSSYVDRVLQTVYPHAYSNLVSWTHSDKPTSQHYYDFISELPTDGTSHWTKIEDVHELRPGDILVFRYKNHLGRETGGHVMIVMDKPVVDEGAFQIRVADSAPARHSEDTREPHVSGIGVGTLMIKENPRTGQPNAYAWKIGSPWRNNVNVAMARPIDKIYD